jgi:transposase
MTLYCGIDLHSTNNFISVLNENDKPLFEKRLPNDLDRVLLALAPYQDELQGVVVESTYNWYWLVDGLMDAGFHVHLANTVAMRQYDGIKYTDDLSDARFLAHLLRLKILPEGYIYPKDERAVRDLLRKRLSLVQQRVTQHLSLQSHIARHTGERLSAVKIKQLNREDLQELFAEPNVYLAAEANLSVMQSLSETIEQIEQSVLEQCRTRSHFKYLTSIPGIGPILGMTIMLETGTIRRFSDAGHFASYCRCVKSEKLSNGKRKGSGNRKNGNKYLAWAFIEAAVKAARFNTEIKAYYQRKMAKGHRFVALKAVANKLAKASYYILRDQVPFDVKRSFG